MIPPMVRFPVTCPQCGNQQPQQFRVDIVMHALLNSGRIALYSTCHFGQWAATKDEIKNIREYLGPSWIEDAISA